MNRFFGWAIIILNIVAVFLAFSYLLTTFQLQLVDLLVVNAGSLGVILLALGFSLNNNLLMAVSVPFLTVYGVFGLVTSSSWQEGIPAEQIGNVLMFLGIIYVIYITINKRSYIEFITGIIIGMFLLILLNNFQTDYLKNKPEILDKLGNLRFEEKSLYKIISPHGTAETSKETR